MVVWVTNYYVAGRHGAMTEKVRVYNGALKRDDVVRKLNTHLDALRSRGVAIYPQQDIYQEKRA